MIKTVVGIDPGLSGAVAILSGAALTVHRCPIFDMKAARGQKREIDWTSLARIFMPLDPARTRVFLERAQTMPGMGGSGCFNYGTGYGIYIGILASYLLQFERVSPRAWKTHFKIGSDKEEARRKATMIFPQFARYWPLKGDHGSAEAALIAAWGAERLGLLGQANEEESAA
jgi:hypothetical protein